MRNHRNSPFFKIKRDTGVEKQCPCKPEIFSYTFVKKYDELGQTKVFLCNSLCMQFLVTTLLQNEISFLMLYSIHSVIVK